MRRRTLLEALVAAASAGLLRCAGSGTSPQQLAEEARRYDPELACDDLSGLWPAEAKTREDNAYVARSTTPGQYCFNCANFIAPAEEGGCATCRTVKGPIHPLGHCTAWTERRT